MIRKATAADAYRLAEIEVFDYRLHFYPIFKNDSFYFAELNVPALIGEYEREPERLFNSFVYDDGTVKGFILVRGEQIEKLFVEPAFQSRGIGGELLDYALRNTDACMLRVLEKNVRAIRFYERHGFRVTAERQPVDDTDELFIVMRRQKKI